MMDLKHKFVEIIPKDPEDNILYISVRFRTAVHKCACGCGNKTVTPFSPTDWKFIFNGKSVSLIPSIGNWNFPCKSHYYITNNNIEWAPIWSDDMIKEGRQENKTIKEQFYKNIEPLNSKGNSKLKRPWWKFWK